MTDMSEFRPNLEIFGVPRIDPGWIYLVKNANLLKIGKTRNPKRRLERDAKTWLPDLEVVGVKPFWCISQVERSLHIALVNYWHAGEWYWIRNDCDSDFFIEGFLVFYEKDRDMNSVDFIYWMNSSGMSEFCIAMSDQNLTLPKFREQRSYIRKGRDQEERFE